MSSILKPFAATYYNPKKIKAISSVICPPYDVIDKKALKKLHKKSPYNFSHVLVTERPDYAARAKKYRGWIKDGVLVDDPNECLYLYEQTFHAAGRTYVRYGILSLLRMDKKGVVFPHEYTLSKPKADRKKMIRAMQSNLSPIFVIIPDKSKVFTGIYHFYTRRPAFRSFTDDGGVHNRVWRVVDKNHVEAIQREAEKHKLVIADGHHRFEISRDYYRKNKNKFKDLNYLLAYIAVAQPGLVILPTHRVVKVKGPLETMLERLSPYFSVRAVSRRILEEKMERNDKKFTFGVYRRGKWYLLGLKQPAYMARAVKDKYFRLVDTYNLHHAVLPLLDLDGEIEYTHSSQEAAALAGKDKTAFILKAVPLDVVCTMANKGYRFPQKSTYFYPKLLSGIVVRRFKK